MAIMNGLTPVRGRLGTTGFRQQNVRVGRQGSGTYKRRTVAFQIQETVSNPRSPGQVRQRSAFSLIVALGTALNAKGILPNYYPSGSGLGNFQKFVGDNVLLLSGGGSISQDPNDPAANYVSFPDLRVTRGSLTIPINVFGSDLPADDCNCYRTLVWGFDATQGWIDPADWKLQMVGVQIDQTGAIEDIVTSTSCASLPDCSTVVALPTCVCCKTYWYGFFVNPFTGYNTASVYLGTCETVVPAYDANNPDCLPCISLAGSLIPFTPPSEDIENCGDTPVDMTNVVFSGLSKFQGGAGPSFNPVVACLNEPFNLSFNPLQTTDTLSWTVNVDMSDDALVFTNVEFLGIPGIVPVGLSAPLTDAQIPDAVSIKIARATALLKTHLLSSDYQLVSVVHLVDDSFRLSITGMTTGGVISAGSGLLPSGTGFESIVITDIIVTRQANGIIIVEDIVITNTLPTGPTFNLDGVGASSIIIVDVLGCRSPQSAVPVSCVYDAFNNLEITGDGVVLYNGPLMGRPNSLPSSATPYALLKFDVTGPSNTSVTYAYNAGIGVYEIVVDDTYIS